MKELRVNVQIKGSLQMEQKVIENKQEENVKSVEKENEEEDMR